jgi:ribosomal protein S18 acetylase RimI-like enzyme
MTVEKPDLNAPDDHWNNYAKFSGTHLVAELALFLVESFGYKERYVKQHLNLGLGATVNAYTLKYDIYLRLFPRPEAGWPRETLVLARIGFQEERKGHGRRLLTMITRLASEIGYKHIAIESANENSSAFGRRFGLQPMDELESNWIGSVFDVQRALEQSV